MTDKIQDWKALAERELKGRDPAELVWESPEGIDIKPLYTAADLDGIGHLGTVPGARPRICAGPGDHVHGTALDDPAVCRVLDGGGIERLLPQGAGRGAAGCLGRLRSGHPPGL